jgi:hypothetical protein
MSFSLRIWDKFADHGPVLWLLVFFIHDSPKVVSSTAYLVLVLVICGSAGVRVAANDFSEHISFSSSLAPQSRRYRNSYVYNMSRHNLAHQFARG